MTETVLKYEKTPRGVFFELWVMSRVEYLRFDNMALTDSTHETSSRLVKLLVEVRGNSEEVISVVTFLTSFEKEF